MQRLMCSSCFQRFDSEARLITKANHQKDRSPEGRLSSRQVSGDALLRGLKAVLEQASGVEEARPALEGYSLTVRLAGVLGLDALSEACVDSGSLDALS